MQNCGVERYEIFIKSANDYRYIQNNVKYYGVMQLLAKSCSILEILRNIMEILRITTGTRTHVETIRTITGHFAVTEKSTQI